VDLLEPIKAKCPDVSYADIFQMASAVAIEVHPALILLRKSNLKRQLANGPVIPMRYGRVDVDGPDGTAPEGNLPGELFLSRFSSAADGDVAGGAPYPAGANGPGQHLRDIFYRMGFNDQEIVALSGAHSLGRAYPSRSGFGKAVL